MRLQVRIQKQYYHTLCKWAFSQHRPLRNQLEMVIEQELQKAITNGPELAAYHARMVEKELSDMAGMEVPIDRG